MDKLSIKKYAVWARNELIERVTQRAYEYGVIDDAPDPALTQTPDGTPFSPVEARQRERLLLEIERHDFRAVMEAAAYTWFNRFAALRFLEVNGYLPSQVRVFTNDAGAFRPAILDECIQMDEPWLDKARIFDYKEASETSALYKYLVIAQCNALGEALPATFEPIADWTELLFPDHILREGSVIDHLVNDIPEDDWRDAVQIIGWLYQYYNTEPKDAVFASKAKVRKQDIPAATQLFTPDWIVRYMVENSLGRYWLERHPEHTAETFGWRYYLPEAEQDPAVAEKLAALRAASQGVRPEDIRLIDPCMGSGHILVYAFDVLYQIYEAAGYPRRKIASLILEHNLYGLDIDERACQLASFAVMMKARQYDKRIFTRGLRPHLAAIEETNHLQAWEGTDGAPVTEEVSALLDTFRDAKEYGSLLTVPAPQDGLLDRWQALKEQATDDLALSAWIGSVDEVLPKLVQQAGMLAGTYEVVVTNPPYMGMGGMSSQIYTYVKNHYKDGKADLYAAMIERCLTFSQTSGYIAMITMQSWMFLSSFEKLRATVLTKKISSLIQIGFNSFPELNSKIARAVAFSILNDAPVGAGVYLDLTNKYPQSYDKEKAFFEELRQNSFYIVNQNIFKKIPEQVIAYWLSEKFIANFSKKSLGDEFISGGRNKTHNNDRFLRMWWEISDTVKWQPYDKGGDFRKWYGNHSYVVDWTDQAKKEYDSHGGLYNQEFEGKEGIQWSLISSKETGFRIKLQKTHYDSGAPTIFNETFSCDNFALGYLNSVVAREYLAVMNPTMNMGNTYVLSLPFVRDERVINQVTDLVRQNISLSKSDWDSFETSWDFQRHPMLTFGATRLEDAFTQWQAACEDRFTQLRANEEELNRIFIDIYGLADELTPDVAERDVTVARIYDTADDIPASMKGNAYVLTRADVARSLISYAVGCMFGRYSLDEDGLVFAGGQWDASRYHAFTPDSDDILPVCDDDYFEDDLVGRYEEWLTAAFGAEHENENLQWTADALGRKGTARETIRSYFLHDFYADHVRRYQSRPIYWCFDAGRKDSFKAFIYIHRYDRDTMARLRTGYVYQQQEVYKAKIEMLEQRLENATTTAEKNKSKKELKKMQTQFDEIHAYEEKIHHYADRRIAIDLDDGVKKNYSIFEDVLGKLKR